MTDSRPGGEGGDAGTADTLTPEEHSSGNGVIAPESGAGAVAGGSGSNLAVRGVGPGDRVGRYELGDELGQGGMATVFRARDRQLRRDVAVKVLFPHLARKVEITRRFQREARAAAVLEHPNILRVYDVGEGDESPTYRTPPFIVMELVRGLSLRDVTEACGPLLAELVACIGALVCDALAIAHAAGVIHRDVKPGNVMLSDDGRLLLADFGVARLDDDDSLVTKSGALLGTPSFMAPEQALGNPVDGRSDLYSVGATLYQLATGSLAFSGPTAKIVADASRGAATPALRRRPAVGAELSRLIERLMAPEPAKRPATATAAAAELRALVSAGGLGDPADEVKAFAADRTGWQAARQPVVVEKLVARAREVRRRAMSQALALVDRALAMAPDHADARALAEELQAPDARRWIVVAGGAAAVAVLAGAGAWIATRGGDGAGGGAADAGALAMLVDDAAAEVSGAADASAPDAATSETAAIDAGSVLAELAPDAREAPGRARDAGMRALRLDAGATAVAVLPVDAGARATPIDATPIDAAARTAPIDAAAAAPARVVFVFDTWCDLVLNGEPRGRADRSLDLRLAAGRYEARCSQGAGLSAWTQTVVVAAGEQRRVEGTLLPPVSVVIDAGDRVRIGTVSAARGQTVTLKPGRYRVEITTGRQPTVVVYVDIPRVARCTLRSSPRVDCYR